MGVLSYTRTSMIPKQLVYYGTGQYGSICISRELGLDVCPSDRLAAVLDTVISCVR